MKVKIRSKTWATSWIFDYSCTSWYSNIIKTPKTKLQTSQNNLVCLLYNLLPRTHLLPEHLNGLRCLRDEDRGSHIKMYMVHKIQHSTVPKYLITCFSKVSEAHRYATRGSATDLAHITTNIEKNSSLYSAASSSSFKTNLRKWFTPSNQGNTAFSFKLKLKNQICFKPIMELYDCNLIDLTCDSMVNMIVFILHWAVYSLFGHF